MRRLLREPLLQLVVLGGILFAGYSLWPRERGDEASSSEIRLTLDDLGQLDMLFQAQWRRPPNAEEFQTLVENRVREEVLYREALKLGLDKDDTIVKRRMVQKMQFLAEEMTAAREPTDGELRSWFERHGDSFALPTRVSFRHLYFSTDRRGERARDDAAAALAKLEGEPQDSELATSLADPFMFRDYYGERSAGEIARDFGTEFAQAVVAVEPGSWQGPVESGYGWHLVYVDTAIPGRVPAFEEVESDVKAAWLEEQKAEAWRKAYARMRGNYTVLLPAPPDESSSAARRSAASPDAGARR